MTAKKLKVAKLSKNQLAEVAKREEANLAQALRSVEIAGTADGVCMLALHRLQLHGLKCAPALQMAVASLGTITANKDSNKSRKTKLKAVAEAIDAKAYVLYKGTRTAVAALLAKVNHETGVTKPGSLQGVYSLLKPVPEKSQAQHRDWVNEQIMQLMQRDVARGGGLWMIETTNATFLKAELKKVEDALSAAADVKASKKAA